MSLLTGKKKKKKEKTRQGQTPAGVLQLANGSTSEAVPEIPSAMEVEVEELLPLPEVGAGVTLSIRHHDAVSDLGTWMKNPLCTRVLVYLNMVYIEGGQFPGGATRGRKEGKTQSLLGLIFAVFM